MEPSLFSTVVGVLMVSTVLPLAGALPAPEPPVKSGPPSSTLRDYLSRAHLCGRFRAYVPHFRIEEFNPGERLEGTGEVWWVYDGEVRVGLVDRGVDHAELVNFDPYHPLPNVTFPKIHHAPTQPGDRITMAKSFLPPGPKPEREDFRWDVTADQATLRVTEYWREGWLRVKTMTWKVDPDFGYVLHCDDEMHAPFFGKMEYSNFLAKGTTDDRRELRRYTYILWEHASGQILRWNQNNMAANWPAGDDPNGLQHLKTGGFIGYFGEKDRSPAIELLESSPDSLYITCPNVLDEHLMWVPGDPAQARKDAEGRNVSRVVFNLVSLPPELCDMLTQKATVPDIYAGGRPPDVSCWAFTQGVPTDFETKLDLRTSFRGVVFHYREDADEPVTVVSDCAHSGTHSLRMRANGKPVEFLMDGGSVHVTEGEHYRLYAWIKTDLTDGQAMLKADECLLTFSNSTAHHQAPPITGKTDWHEVTLDFTPGERAHVVVLNVAVTGHGTVWVDDLLLTESPRQ